MCMPKAVLALILLSLVTLPAVAGEQQRLTVTGTLDRAVAIGGESTGWNIRFDTPMTIEGKEASSIEASGDAARLGKLAGKHVRARGRLSHKHGVERGDWPVLEVYRIRAVKSAEAAAAK